MQLSTAQKNPRIRLKDMKNWLSLHWGEPNQMYNNIVTVIDDMNAIEVIAISNTRYRLSSLDSQASIKASVTLYEKSIKITI